MTPLDKRLHAYRDDLADSNLKGRVEAARFVEGQNAQCIAPIAGLHRAPAVDAMQLTQVLYGERVRVFERALGWAFVQLVRDGYVGYVVEAALGAPSTVVQRAISARSTHLYPKPDLKTQPAIAVPMNAEVAVVGHAGDYLELQAGSFVFAAHIAASASPDFVSVAEQFLHTPYLWGGKSVWGIDCSGLVQVALQASGITALRDSDMQETSLGTAVPHQALCRGDLVFWKGHVGIMQDADRLLHANGHHMMVVSEPLAAAISRIAGRGSHITSIKRL